MKEILARAPERRRCPRVEREERRRPEGARRGRLQADAEGAGGPLRGAEELWTALDKIRIQHGLAAHGIKPGSKKPLVIALIVTLLAAGAAIWVVTRPKPPPEKTEEEKAADRARIQRQKDLEFQAAEGARNLFFSDVTSKIEALKTEVLKNDVEKSWANEALWKDFFERAEKVKQELEAKQEYAADDRMKLLLESIEKLVGDTKRELSFNGQNSVAIKQATRISRRTSRKRSTDIGRCTTRSWRLRRARWCVGGTRRR